jgi:TPR repeat protein
LSQFLQAIHVCVKIKKAKPRIFRAILLSLVLMIGFVTPVIAGPFEDALAADKRGDYATAAQLYRPLAEQGDATAQHNLGVMYSTGHGVQQDFAEAARWYRKAAEQGYAPSQTNLGNCYYYGLGVLQDYAEAMKWFRKAAEQDFPAAQTSLGWMYAYGRGVQADDAEAVKWYRRAADRGDARGRSRLALMYLRGRGVKRNLALAYRWSSLALAQGFQSVGLDSPKNVRDTAVQLMTASEIAEVKKQDEFYRRYGSMLKIHAKLKAIMQDPKRDKEYTRRLQSVAKKMYPQSERETEFIHAIQFVDETTGFALDYNGNIHETHDGGLTWSQRRMPLELDLKERLFEKLTKPFFRSPEFLAMHFADREFGMALDRLNPVVTRDGGKTWVGVPRPPTKDQLRALWCTKKHTCYVGGTPTNAIYVLRDGEKKWTRQRSNAGCCLYSIQFVDELKGWGGRTRTSEWRNKNPISLPMISKRILKNLRNSTHYRPIG